MLPFGVTILATVPQSSEIPEGLMNYPVFIPTSVQQYKTTADKHITLLHVSASWDYGFCFTEFSVTGIFCGTDTSKMRGMGVCFSESHDITSQKMEIFMFTALL
jgi:hypothetical protein